ncbi:MAG: potassium channel family protein [Paludibacteraceae bacterium]
MTYVIVGLGNFGVALAERLTALGHEVVGVDSNMNLVEEYKNTIGSTICINLADAASLQMLPLADADEVIVTLGEHVGNSVLVVALLKQHGVKRLVARAGNRLHRTILEAIGVDEVIMPESYAAELFSISSEVEEVKGAYIATETHQLVELEVPDILVSQTPAQANLTETFGLDLVGVKRRFTKKSLFGKDEFYYEMADMKAENFRFAANDRMLLFGNIAALQKIKKQLY